MGNNAPAAGPPPLFAVPKTRVWPLEPFTLRLTPAEELVGRVHRGRPHNDPTRPAWLHTKLCELQRRYPGLAVRCISIAGANRGQLVGSFRIFGRFHGQLPRSDPRLEGWAATRRRYESQDSAATVDLLRAASRQTPWYKPWARGPHDRRADQSRRTLAARRHWRRLRERRERERTEFWEGVRGPWGEAPPPPPSF